MKTFKTLIIVVLIFLFSINIHAQTDWLMVNGCPQRTNYAAEDTLLKPPFEIETTIAQWGEFILKKDNVLYLPNGGDPNKITAYDNSSQKEIWKFELEGSGGGISFFPAISGDKIFIGGQNAKGLYALDRLTGEQKWFRDFGNLFRRNPILDNEGHIFVSNSSNKLSCLNENTGENIWSIDAPGYLTPTYDNNKVFISTYENLIALNSKTGEVLWKRIHAQGPSGQILVDESGTFLCVNRTIGCYNPETGGEKWYYQLPDSLYVTGYDAGTACLSDSVLCVSLVNGSYTHGSLLAINKFTGKKLWEYISEYPFIKGPSAANGIFYSCADSRPWIAGFKQMTGEKVFEDKSQNYWNMIIVNHRLYALSSSGITIFKTKTSGTNDNSNSKDISITAYPNPTSDEMTISYNIPETGKIKISLFDFTGKKVQTICNSVISSGNHKTTYNISRLIPGIYFLVLKSKTHTVIEKIVLCTKNKWIY